VPTDAGASAEREWPATLDVQSLIGRGWQPAAYREFVLKIHSRCDLACDYCYMYTMADQSWRRQPIRMSRAILDAAVVRIAEHIRQHRPPSAKIILHGGEPLLAGPDFITYAVISARQEIEKYTRLEIVIQTNGVNLDAAYLTLLGDLGVRVGVSIDGNASAQDRHRIYANGKGSHASVEAGLRRLASKPYRRLFSGLLCTIDTDNDPLATYEAMLDFGPPMIDFLLPHGNWESPPAGRITGSADTPYADWLISVFDRWYSAPRRETNVRLFSEIMHVLLGGSSRTEAIGLSPVAVAVIETDGHIEQADSLKSAFSGAPFTGLHVTRDTFDAALLQPMAAARQIGAEALSGKCLSCRAVKVCGGGNYTHRYRPGSGFFNPSVYCPDLLKLINHIRNIMGADIASLRGM
jgi:uncharacterized protein